MKANKELTEKQRNAISLQGYVKRKRDKGEATGWLISKMDGKYHPESWNLRPGAEDHKQYKSKGL